MAGFLYPRTITVRRFPGVTANVGATGYGGLASGQQSETDPRNWPTVDGAVGLPASIQIERTGRQSDEKLPSDALKPIWKVFIPAAAASNGLIEKRDAIEDDLGNLYYVIADYWNSLGYSLRAITLET